MRISGIGCSLLDYIYHHYSYQNEMFQSLLSQERGDGGIIPGGLVFTEDLGEFADVEVATLIESLTKNLEADAINLGGPAIVAMVHASQLLREKKIEATFSGAVGDDKQAKVIEEILKRTPLQATLKRVSGSVSPSTHVLSDPDEHDGKGERSFLNTIGAANHYTVEDVPSQFYKSEIVLMGGTALVPPLHDHLDKVISKAHQQGAFSVVGTVFDFRNERKGVKKWPLGATNVYDKIDLLVVDAVEAMRLTDTEDLIEAAQEFKKLGTKALIITNGAKEMVVYSTGEGRVKEFELSYVPVSRYVDELLEEKPELRKDSTGCGDNFVGGVLVSVALQLEKDLKAQVDLLDVCAWGAASGGFACMYHGGTYFEEREGEKLEKVTPFVERYLSDAPAAIKRI